MTTMFKFSLMIIPTINQAYCCDDSTSTVTAITLNKPYLLWFPST